jgi:predicted chitinase
MVYYVIYIKCFVYKGSVNDYNEYKIGNTNLLNSIENYLDTYNDKFIDVSLIRKTSDDTTELTYQLVIELDTYNKQNSEPIQNFVNKVFNGIIDNYKKYNALYSVITNISTGHVNKPNEVDDNYHITIALKDIPKPNPPIPSFKINYDPNKFPTDIKIVDESKNSVKYQYDFGDGEKSFLKEPNKTYTTEGTYDIVLTTVSADNLSATSTQTIIIKKPVDPIVESKTQDEAPDNEDSTSENQVDKTANVNEVKPEEQATNIKIETPNDPDFQKEFVRGTGFSPVIYYSSLLIDNSTIDYFSLYNDGFIPCIKLNFRDSSGMIKSKSFPLDDTKIKVFISSRSSNLKSIILEFKITNFSNNDGMMMIDGILHSSKLYNKAYNIYSDSTSYKALKKISTDIGLGFNSNINDTDDQMNWLQNGKKFLDFIESIVERSYISDKTFLAGYIDYYQCFNYIDVEKEMDRDISEQHGINTTGLESANDNNAKIDVQPLILTNDESMLESNNYFSKFKVINRAAEISAETGYIQNTAFYDRNKKQLVNFKIDSITKNEDSKIILKGDPNDPNSTDNVNNNQNHHYLGKLDTSNVHSNYFYTKINNWKNTTDLGKIEIDIEMGNPNFNLYQFQKVNLILSNKSPMGGDDSMNNTRLSGEWLLIDIEYVYTNNKFSQNFRLVKRELELSKEELEAEKNNTNTDYKKENSEDTENPPPSPETTGTPKIENTNEKQSPKPKIPTTYNKSNLDPITPSIKKTLDAVEKACRDQGITNIYIIKAIKANIMKETGGKINTEGTYRGTPVFRLRNLFSKRLKNLTDAQIVELTKNDIEFYDVIYGYKAATKTGLGNDKPGDGYKYRGRGYLQMTGKEAYAASSKALGKDYLNNPDLVSQPYDAAATLIWEIKRAFKIICKWKKYNLDVNNPQPESQEQANLLITNCAAGTWELKRPGNSPIWVEIINKVDGYSGMV